MDGLLLEESRKEQDSGGWMECVRELRLELTQVRGEVATLRRENLELRQQVGYWKGMHACALERIAVLEQENEHLRGENRRLQQQLFGKKSEKQSAADRSNHLDGFDDKDLSETNSSASPGPKKKQRGPKRRDFSHLPAQEKIVELPADERFCPTCRKPFAVMTDTEDSEQIEIEVKPHRRVIRRRRYRKTCTCPGCQTITAPAPAKLIPKSVLGTSVWVEILLAKYFNHQPTERLLASWRLLDLDLADSTVNAGLERLQPLFTPIYEALQERNRLSAYQQADETRWLVFVETEGKQGHRWWLWVFNGEDTVVYVLDPYRSHDVPEGHFTAGIGVVLMVDRLASYKAMAPVKAGLILLAFCWAHVRRDFIAAAKSFPELKPWAIDWLKRIRQAYRANRERLRRASDRPKFVAADIQLRDVMDAMKTTAAAQLADADLRLPCRKVLRSLQEHWTGLTRFVDDARIPMDNNASERRLRGPGLGRKNYYGSSAVWSGQLAMMLFSVFATLSKWTINPRRWLRWYLDACALDGGQTPSDIRPFLPWNMSAEQRQNMAEPIPSRDSGEMPDSS
jgi:transposase